MKSLKVFLIPLLLFSFYKIAIAEFPVVKQLTNEILQLGKTTSSYQYFDHSDEDACFATTVDSSGNYYCAGGTYGSLGEENGGQQDAFVMKVASTGEILWTRQLGASTKVVDNEDYNSDHDACLSVAVDSSGNVYCGGRTDGDLGEANGGDDDLFVMKLDPNGGLLWVTQFGEETTGPAGDTSEDEACAGVAVDSSGNVYCGGYTAGAIGEVNGDDTGVGVDALVLKLDPNGAVVWVKQLGSATTVPGGDTSKHDECKGLAVDGSGNVYCAGSTEGNLGEANAGGRDLFVMKLDSAGNLNWLKQLGTTTVGAGGDNTDDDECAGVAVDTSGNVYCAGATEGSLGEANGGNGDAFVLKFDSTGTLSWVTQLGSTTVGPGGDNSDEDRCNGVAVDSSGNVICAGETGGAIGEHNAGQEDAFAIKLDSAGKLIASMQLGLESNQFRGDNEEASNEDQDKCQGVAVDTSGNVICAGKTTGDLGEMNAGAQDAFIWKFQLEPVLPPCQGTETEGCTPEPEPDPCDASPTDPACEPEPDPCDASPTDPACEPEPDPCDASPTGEGCQEPDPGECPGTVEDGLCLPPPDCNLLTGNSADLETCCNYDWDVNSPEICIAHCSEPQDRANSEWCCDGTVDPRDPNCDNTSLTQKDLNSMMKTLGLKR